MSEISKVIESEIADFFAGFGGPGEPDIQNGEAQRLLTERVLSVLALRERAEPVVCPKCGNTGLADSGGVQPWGEPILIECDCTAPPAPVALRGLEQHLADKQAESNELNDRYVKIRAIIDAMHVPHNYHPDDSDRYYRWTEQKARDLVMMAESAKNASPTAPVAWVPQYQLDLLKKSVIVEADLSSMKRFDEVPLYAAPPAPVEPVWIACSERMPEVGDIVLTADNGGVNVGEMERSGASYRYFTSVVSGRELPATHWMPLPEAPGKN